MDEALPATVTARVLFCDAKNVYGRELWYIAETNETGIAVRALLRRVTVDPVDVHRLMMLGVSTVVRRGETEVYVGHE